MKPNSEMKKPDILPLLSGAVITAALLAGCSVPPGQRNETDEPPIWLSATLAEWDSSQADNPGTTGALPYRQTRALADNGQTSMENMFDLGIYITENAPAIAVNYPENMLCRSDIYGDVEFPATCRFPDTGKGVVVTGYRPHSAKREVDYILGVAPDQSTDILYDASDLLYAPPHEIEPGEKKEYLSFRHALAGMRFDLICGSGLPQEQFGEASVSITGICNSYHFNRKTGAITLLSDEPGAFADIKSHPERGVVFAPQKIKAGQPFFKVTLPDGQELTAALDADTEFQAGVKYEYAITVYPGSITAVPGRSASRIH